LRFGQERFHHEDHEVHEEILLKILHGPSCSSWSHLFWIWFSQIMGPEASFVALPPCHHPHNPQQYNRPNGGCNQRANGATETSPNQAEQKAPDHGTNYAHNQVTDQAKPSAAHNLPGQPTGNQADNKKPYYVHESLLLGKVKPIGYSILTPFDKINN
jgi:hypothetical protein